MACVNDIHPKFNQIIFVLISEYYASRLQLNPGTEDVPELRPSDYDHKVPLDTSKEMKEEIRYLNAKKTPGFDLISDAILKKLLLYWVYAKVGSVFWLKLHDLASI